MAFEENIRPRYKNITIQTLLSRQQDSRKRGLQLKVIACPRTDAPYVQLLNSSLRELGVKVAELESFGRQYPYSLSQFFAYRSRGYELLHLHWVPFRYERILKLVRNAAEEFGVKVVWTVHNILPHEPQFADDLAVMRGVAEWADLGIVHSDRTKAVVSEKLSSDLRLVTIPHGHFNMLAKSVPAEEARKRIGIGEDKTVLLLFAPDRRNKGIDTFVEVLEKLPPNYVGILAGRCPDKDIRAEIGQAKRRLAPRLITDLRFIPDEEVPAYFSAADIYFIPYKWITTSGSAFFAFSYRKPVVTTPEGHLPDIIENGENGHLVSNVDEMVEVIGGIDQTRAKEMGSKAYEMAAKYDWGGIARKTLEAYNSVLS
jgi:glycosyltransferase involved in cell wall biosynthesis